MRSSRPGAAVLLLSLSVVAPALGAGEDPVWTLLPEGGAPSARTAHVRVWTGAELVVWGGSDGDRDLATGARFRPESGTWTPLPSAGAPSARSHAAAVWTGDVVLVWGGASEGGFHADGAAYDPRADAWSPLPREGAPSARAEHAIAWTGDEAIVWGGVTDEAAPVAGGRYDPKARAWRPLPTAGAPEGRRGHAAVAGGGRLYVWGGLNGSRPLGDGACYDPALDLWSPIPREGAPSARAFAAAAWAGDRVVVWGGRTHEDGRAGPVSSGAVYDPATGAWTPLPAEGAPSPRTHPFAAWTGSHLLVWGGVGRDRSGTASLLVDGAVWRPGSRRWGTFRALSERTGSPDAFAADSADWGGAHDLPGDRGVLFGTTR